MSQPVDPIRRSYWLKTLHAWHWISSALCLVGILLFSITGITLNHSAQIEAKAVVSTQKSRLPAELLAELATATSETGAALPESLRDWLEAQLDVRVGARSAEWSDSEIYVSMPRAGGDAWLSIDRASGGLVRAQRSRLDFLAQRPAQGPQYRSGMELVHRCVCHCLRGLCADRVFPAAPACAAAPVDLATCRAGFHGHVADCHSFCTLRGLACATR
jgi:hypothetical protein